MADATSAENEHTRDGLDSSPLANYVVNFERIARIHDVIGGLEPTDPRRTTLRQVGIALAQGAFNQTGSRHHLDTAISFAEGLVEESLNSVEFHKILLGLLKQKEALTSAPDDMDYYIRAVSAAIAITPDGPQKREWQSSLHLARYIRSSRSSTVPDASSMMETLTALRENENTNGKYSIHLAWTMLERYEREGKLSDLTEAIKLHEVGLDSLEEGDPLAWNAICILTEIYITHYTREQDLDILCRAIAHLEKRAAPHLHNHASIEYRNDKLAYLQMLRYFREPTPLELHEAFHNALNETSASFQALSLDTPEEKVEVESILIDKFIYQPLDDMKNNFRLIELGPGVKESKITCRLVEFPFIGSPKYEVLYSKYI
jgi:hypothetical protein